MQSYFGHQSIFPNWINHSRKESNTFSTKEHLINALLASHTVDQRSSTLASLSGLQLPEICWAQRCLLKEGVRNKETEDDNKNIVEV